MTFRDQSSHLSDTEFTDLLLGSIPPTVTAHLESCATCAEEARRVSSSILSFERDSRLWAEHRAAAQPALVTPTGQGSWLHVPGFGLAWQAAAALTVVCAGIGIGYQVQHRTEAPETIASISAPQAFAHVSPSTLKADNDLLSAIDGELQAAATPPASVFGLQVSDRPSQSRKGSKVTD